MQEYFRGALYGACVTLICSLHVQSNQIKFNKQKGHKVSCIAIKPACYFITAMSPSYPTFKHTRLYVHCVSIKRDPDIIDCNFGKD